MRNYLWKKFGFASNEIENLLSDWCRIRRNSAKGNTIQKNVFNLARCKSDDNQLDSIPINKNHIFNLYDSEIYNPSNFVLWLRRIEMNRKHGSLIRIDSDWSSADFQRARLKTFFWIGFPFALFRPIWHQSEKRCPISLDANWLTINRTQSESIRTIFSFCIISIFMNTNI